MSEHDNTAAPRTDDLLAAYELGLLGEEERLRFEKLGLEDPALLEEIFEHASVAQALRDDPTRYETALCDALREAEPSPAERLAGWLRTLIMPRVLAPVVVVAAAVALLVVLPGDDALQRIAVLDPAPYVQVDTRSAGSDAAALFREGMDRYLDASYGDAAQLLDEALNAGDAQWHQADQARLYLGVSRLLDGDSEGAVVPLTVSASSSQMPIAERSRWYLAQAGLIRGDVSAAREALETLTSSPVYGEAAAAQLLSLEELKAE